MDREGRGGVDVKDNHACPKCGSESGHTILSRGVLFHCNCPECQHRWEGTTPECVKVVKSMAESGKETFTLDGHVMDSITPLSEEQRKIIEKPWPKL